jgi:hypothetical protein
MSCLKAAETHKQTVKSEPSFTSISLKGGSNEVPPFVLADWSTRFLPTLYHVLFCSEKPFHDFSKGTGLVDAVQQVLDIVHHNHSYVVTAKSKLYLNVATFSPSLTSLANCMLP